MTINHVNIQIENLGNELKKLLKQPNKRLGLLTSIDGSQLITLVLNTDSHSVDVINSDLLDKNSYSSLSASIPQAHWFERTLYEMFGVFPKHHPRLKSVIFNDSNNLILPPLANKTIIRDVNQVDTSFINIEAENVYIVPVGPVHAGIIEPGHFRITCVGETIINLEIRLGFLHRGVEKQMTKIPYAKTSYLASSIASDTSIANSLANAIAMEQLLNIDVSERTLYLRTLALELERLSMHINDLSGMCTDIAYSALAMELARLRGIVFNMADNLTGSRYFRYFIGPGGVRKDCDKNLIVIKKLLKELKNKLFKILFHILNNFSFTQRLDNIGKLSRSLANDFNMVGVVARASGIQYDTRSIFNQGIYPQGIFKIAKENNGDVLGRTKVRIVEIFNSFEILENVLDNIKSGDAKVDLNHKLSPNSFGVGIVESFRGELIHLIVTDNSGFIKRYSIKDPSFNNWTGLAIACRNNLLSDFPICNKSFGLSYSGHDL